MIKITFTYTPADIRSGTTLLIRKRNTHARLVFVITGVFILFCAAISHHSWIGYRSFLVCLGLFLVLFVDVVLRLFNWHMRTCFARRNKDIFFDPRTMEIDEKEIVMTVGETRSEQPWETIIGYRTGKRNILLYLSKDNALMIPRIAFLNQGTETDFIRLLREKDIPEI